MTDDRCVVTTLDPDEASGTIAHLLTPDSPEAGRIYRRRRLGLLAAALVVTLGVGAIVGQYESQPVSVAAATAPNGVVGESASAPVTLVDLVADTSSKLIAATTTTSTAPSTTSTTETPSTTSSSSTSSTTEAAPSTTSAPRASSPEPTSPPTTSAPTTTSPPTTAAPTTTAPQSSGGDYSDPNTLQVWLDLADCEASGDWAADTGNGYYGGLQFSLGSWESVGGTGYPNEYPRDTQIEMGRRLQAREGWEAWPACAEKLGLT